MTMTNPGEIELICFRPVVFYGAILPLAVLIGVAIGLLLARFR
jgi:hypothetical protein